MIRGSTGTIEREGAEIGLFVILEEPFMLTQLEALG